MTHIDREVGPHHPQSEQTAHLFRSESPSSVAEFAFINGHREIADDLHERGATPARLSAADAFVAAVLAGDSSAAASTPQQVVEEVLRRRTGLPPEPRVAQPTAALLPKSGSSVHYSDFDR